MCLDTRDESQGRNLAPLFVRRRSIHVLASAATVIVVIQLAIVGRMIGGIGELTIPVTRAGAKDKWGDVVIE